MTAAAPAPPPLMAEAIGGVVAVGVMDLCPVVFYSHFISVKVIERPLARVYAFTGQHVTPEVVHLPRWVLGI